MRSPLPWFARPLDAAWCTDGSSGLLQSPSLTMKVVTVPLSRPSLSIHIWPFMRVTNRLQMASPSPAPPLLRLDPLCGWANLVKRCGTSCGRTPQPESLTCHNQHDKVNNKADHIPNNLQGWCKHKMLHWLVSNLGMDDGREILYKLIMLDSIAIWNTRIQKVVLNCQNCMSIRYQEMPLTLKRLAIYY